MKKNALLSLVFIAIMGVAQTAFSGYYYPTEGTYDSHGRVAIVRRVQLALQQEGYYTADNRGNYCAETRVAVRRYQRDHGLPETGKIDAPLLSSLGLS